jgi:hypothetical protein
MSDKTPGDPVIGDITTRRGAVREPESDRRRHAWRDFRHAYPGFIFTLAVALFVMLAVDGWLVYRRIAYVSDISTLRGHMSGAERQRSDAIVSTTQDKIRIEVELAKRQSRFDVRLHLNVSVDSARMYLTRQGAILREMPVAFGPERNLVAGADSVPATVPKGERTIIEVGDGGIVLDGGSRIFAAAAETLDKDPTPIPAGSLRIGRADFDAIKPDLSAGMKIYFY